MTRIRDWVGLQKEMIQEIGSILSIMLLTVNLSVTMFLLLSPRGGVFSNAYVLIPSLIIGIGLAVWLTARLWHFVGMMHKSKQRALVVLNPFMTTDFTPHEWMLWKEVSLPGLYYMKAMMQKLELDTRDVEARIQRVEEWLENGGIPKSHFPKRFERYLRAV